MNKYNIKDFLRNKLDTHTSTLKETSFDTANSEHLCTDTSTDNVYNFDDYIEQIFDKSRLPASPDAILLGEKKLYFIEFKNQIPANIDSNNIKDKFVKGTELLKEMLKDFIPNDVEFIFCVVHKNNRQGYFDASHIQSMAPKFGLEQVNKDIGNFYSNIIIERIDFYKDNFQQLQC